MAERKLARSSLKGYTFQNYVFTLFLAKMDVERKIIRIESEAIGTKQFDDLYVKMDDEVVYRIQVKNYPDTKIDDIIITEGVVKIKTNSVSDSKQGVWLPKHFHATIATRLFF